MDTSQTQAHRLKNGRNSWGHQVSLLLTQTPHEQLWPCSDERKLPVSQEAFPFSSSNCKTPFLLPCSLLTQQRHSTNVFEIMGCHGVGFLGQHLPSLSILHLWSTGETMPAPHHALELDPSCTSSSWATLAPDFISQSLSFSISKVGVPPSQRC